MSNADELLEAFQRMVKKQDYWRGYVGWEDEDPSDEEVLAWLQEARDALAARAVETQHPLPHLIP